MISYVAIVVLVFVLVADYGLLIFPKLNLYKELLIYYQTTNLIGGYRELFNWFSILICIFFWLERKKLDNIYVFIVTQYFIIKILLIK